MYIYSIEWFRFYPALDPYIGISKFQTNVILNFVCFCLFYVYRYVKMYVINVYVWLLDPLGYCRHMRVHAHTRARV